MLNIQSLKQSIKDNVDYALQEDLGDGDISAQLIPENHHSQAQIICREAAILCGQQWVEEVFQQLDKKITIQWHFQDGQQLNRNDMVASLQGPIQGLLTGERCALNFLQTLSGTATICRQYSEQVKHTKVKLLDTRKTLPGLRLAQKYAVLTGGCNNHRIGLFDAYLIKENHIMACGSIKNAVNSALSRHPEKNVEVEVENFDELQQALDTHANIIMLDNFSISDINKAVQLTQGKAKLEASGNINEEILKNIAETGVDYISIGALTKHCRAVDYSLRIVNN